jgi:Skp family chaperone for outer membrane proteins
MKIFLATIPIALLPTLFALVGLAQAPAKRPPLAIGYVSANRILVETTDGKAVAARIQAMQQQKAAELRGKQQTLETTRQQLSQATENQVRANLQQQELQQRLDFERSTAQAQVDLQTLQRQSQTEMLGKLKPILEDLAKSHDLLLVINADTALAWAAPALDLTAAAVERMNAKPAPPKP